MKEEPTAVPKKKQGPLKVNAHLHTPHSFSAFCCVEEAVIQAKEEDVKVIGINDFFTFDGYDAWSYQTIKNGLFPLFNVEFIGLDEEKKKKGLRVNDPANPGRTYLSGKGLAYPVVLPEEDSKQLKHILEKNNEQVRQMMEKVNDILRKKGYKFQLSFEDIKKEFAKEQVRERHLARAIRDLAVKKFSSISAQKAFYKDLFGDKELTSDISNEAAVENEIRSKLLKAGGAAFVEEDPTVFLDTAAIRDIIIRAGGIPTYPFLADDAKGNYTDFEGDLPAAMADLKKRGFYSAEFIPTRNNHDKMKEYVMELVKEGFVVTFGTEHNAPGKQPVEVYAGNKTPLDDELLKINYEGACIVAAHQYLFDRDGKGVLDANRVFRQDKRKEFADLGDRLIKSVVK
ncbi:MAG: hypothetical protein GXO47_14645 [Chlorobi bacterium]|nr:hypothetical protein [Chlorobiota bacterium]